MSSSSYDAIVIGSGQAGSPLSTALARAGRRTALIEREHVAGTCINEGCTPTKTMVASARVAYLARRAADYGVDTGAVSVDMVRVRQRKRDIVESFRGGSERRIQSTPGVDLIMGEARFVGLRTIEVDRADQPPLHLDADLVFINAGARPSQSNVPGVESLPALNSTSIMELDVVPEHLIVLGGGYVGLEFGQMFRRFGSRVTIVQRGGRLLGREDADVAEAVAEILRQDGIDVLLRSQATQAERTSGDGIAVTLQTPDGERVLTGSHLLEATGRVPNSDSLNLGAAGIAADDRGFITVDESLHTSSPGTYALGDIKGGPAFTHISYDDFRIVRANLIDGGHASTRRRLVPYTVFIDPQLGRIGIGEDEARAQSRPIRVAKMPMNYIARALEVDEPRGFMKAVVDAETDQILGAAILGLEGGEMMAQVQIAMLGKLPFTALRDAVFAHPTLAEAWNNLFSELT